MLIIDDWSLRWKDKFLNRLKARGEDLLGNLHPGN